MTEVLKVDPRVDFVAKRILSKPHILLSLIKAVLEPDRIQVKSLEHLTPVDERLVKLDKTIVFDAHVQLQDGSRVIIEIQLHVPHWTGDRILYNWSRGCVKMLSKGDHYTKIEPLYSIWILGSNLFDDDKPLHCFKVYDPSSRTVLSNKLQIYTIELKKGPEESNIKSDLERWMCFFQQGRYYDPSNPPSALKTPPFLEAFEMMYEITQEDRDWAAYEQEQRILRFQLTREYEDARLRKENHSLKDALFEAEESRALAEDRAQQESEQRKRLEEEVKALKAKLNENASS